MSVVELDGDEVFSGFGRDVGDAAAPVLPVFEVDLRLGRAFHRDRETAGAGFASPNHELVRQTHLACASGGGVRVGGGKGSMGWRGECRILKKKKKGMTDCNVIVEFC